jgi:hypothetical protein
MLDLPAYPCEAILEEKLAKAVEYCNTYELA